MLGYGIAFVLRKTVAWILRIESMHVGVPVGLGKNGCRGDRQTLAVSFHDRQLRNFQTTDTPRIAQDVIWCRSKPFHGAPHRENTGPIDIDGIDFIYFGK